mmetsp:Transcript_36333/g.111858  ORF Transcript_36333/g.111858 Transcript_36333/m.111858 type:complete len:201 (-) Transcript_36333:318-920(-)
MLKPLAKISPALPGLVIRCLPSSSNMTSMPVTGLPHESGFRSICSGGMMATPPSSDAPYSSKSTGPNMSMMPCLTLVGQAAPLLMIVHTDFRSIRERSSTGTCSSLFRRMGGMKKPFTRCRSMEARAFKASNFGISTKVVPSATPTASHAPGMAWYSGALTSCTGCGIILATPHSFTRAGLRGALPSRRAPFGLPVVPPV